MNDIAIRQIQHYLYCPHRWGLLEIDRTWAGNIFVTKANIIHNRVNEHSKYSIRGKKVFTSVSVYNDDYGIYGVVDCIEGTVSHTGVKISNDNKKYDLCIVEYKPTKPKNKDYNYEDLMQVFVQKLCVDYVFNCDCDAVLYYADVKKRFKLPLKDNFNEYDNKLKSIISEIRKDIEYGIIPPINKGQNCNGCSIKDICMPSYKPIKSVREYINEIWEEDL